MIKTPIQIKISEPIYETDRRYVERNRNHRTKPINQPSSQCSSNLPRSETFSIHLPPSTISSLPINHKFNITINELSTPSITNDNKWIMMIDVEQRSELVAYRKALEMAWLDGVITYDEARILDTLRDYLHITDEEHWMLQNEVRTIVPDPGINEYKMALEQVWMDGLLTDMEKEMLKKLREKYNISDDVHMKLEQKVKSDLGISDKESEMFYPEPMVSTKENYLKDQDPKDRESELYWINEGKKQWYNSKQDEVNGLKAIQFLNKAIEINPKSFIAWIYKGCIYKKLNKPDRAIECYDKAIELKKDFIASWYNKGILLAQVSLDQIEEAIACFDEVLKINPNHPLAVRDKEIFNKLAKICVEQQKD